MSPEAAVALSKICASRWHDWDDDFDWKFEDPAIIELVDLGIVWDLHTPNTAFPDHCLYMLSSDKGRQAFIWLGNPRNPRR